MLINKSREKYIQALLVVTVSYLAEYSWPRAALWLTNRLLARQEKYGECALLAHAPLPVLKFDSELGVEEAARLVDKWKAQVRGRGRTEFLPELATDNRPNFSRMEPAERAAWFYEHRRQRDMTERRILIESLQYHVGDFQRPGSLSNVLDQQAYALAEALLDSLRDLHAKSPLVTGTVAGSEAGAPDGPDYGGDWA